MNLPQFHLAVQVAIVMSGVFLWLGMLTGVWKYWQIRQSAIAKAHYYVDIAHRSSLLYAPACLILAVLSQYSVWSKALLLFCVVANLLYFGASVLSYIVHGVLQDTTNQFKTPHQLGKKQFPKFAMSLAMLSLCIIEVTATGVLVLGNILFFIDI